MIPHHEIATTAQACVELMRKAASTDDGLSAQRASLMTILDLTVALVFEEWTEAGQPIGALLAMHHRHVRAILDAKEEPSHA